MDLLDGTKGFLPQVHCNGALQLLKPHINETCDDLLLVQLECVLLGLIFFSLRQVIAELREGKYGIVGTW